VAYIAADKGPQITRFELSDGALVESCTQRLKHEVSCMEPFAEKSALVLGTRSPSLEIREVVRLEMLREYPLSNWNLLPQLPQQKDPAILQQLKPTQRTPGIPESVCVHVDEAGPTVVASLRGGMLVTWTIRDGFTLEHKQTKFIDFSSGQVESSRRNSGRQDLSTENREHLCLLLSALCKAHSCALRILASPDFAFGAPLACPVQGRSDLM